MRDFELAYRRFGSINGGADRPAHWPAYTPTFSVIADMPASRPSAQEETYAPQHDDVFGGALSRFRRSERRAADDFGKIRRHRPQGRGLKSSLTPIQVAVLLSQCRQVPKGWKSCRHRLQKKRRQTMKSPGRRVPRRKTGLDVYQRIAFGQRRAAPLRQSPRSCRYILIAPYGSFADM